jgi:integrase
MNDSIPKSNTQNVTNKDFDITLYVESKYVEKRKNKYINRFLFSDTRIEKLPFFDEGLVDFKDSHTDRDRFIKTNLVLRVSKTSKVFYSQINGKMGKKLGDWYKRKKSGGVIPKGCLTTGKAREKLEEVYQENQLLDDRVAYMRRKTLREYIEKHYAIDREDTALENGKCTPVTKATKDTLLRDFEPWLDRKIEDVKPEWAKEFRSTWGNMTKKVTNDDKGKVETVPLKTTGTMRSAFGYFKAMMGICKSKGYIAKNPMKEQGFRFPENPVTEKNYFSLDRGEVVNFMFSDEFDQYHSNAHTANFEGRLIVATIVLSGCRPIEVRTNYKNNFRISERLITIQPGLQKKNGYGRNNAIENDLYWEKVDYFINNLYIDNPEKRMFYSHNSQTGYVSESKYRYHWQAVKEKFGLKEGDFLYHNRHVISTDVAERLGSKRSASMLGHSESIANKNYRDTVSSEVRTVMRKLQNSEENNKQLDNTKEAEVTSSLGEIIELNAMPDSIKRMYDVFSGIRKVPAQNQLYQSDWLLFSSKIKQRLDSGKLDEDAEDWYELII